MRAFLPLVLLLWTIATGLVKAEGVITSIARVRELTVEEATAKKPVSIEGVATFYDPQQRELLIHDGREGIFVTLPKNDGTRPIFQAGSRVRVEGVTGPGGYLPFLVAKKLTALGDSALPEPRRITESELFSPALDCQWVETPGVVTGIEAPGKYFTLAVEVSGLRLTALLPMKDDDRAAALRIMQRPVMIRGVVGTVFNEQRQLTDRFFFTPGFEYLTPLDAEPADGMVELRTVDTLLRSDVSPTSRVRVQGVVTWSTESGLWIRGVGGGMLVRALETDGFAPGDRMEAEGFAAAAPFRPMLRAVRIAKLGRQEAPRPAKVDITKESFVGFHNDLAAVDADFLARREDAKGMTALQCRADKWIFEARLPQGCALGRTLTPGDRLRLTGIFECTTTSRAPWSTAVDGFQVRLRGAEDIAMLHAAPWWTLNRLLWALGLMAVLALTALAGVELLRRRVQEQTRIIGAQIEREAVRDERERIARELHDTIEQNLAGLSVQLRNARQRLANAPEKTDRALALAQGMLRHCREEARASIHDLRSVALEQRGLPGAMQELLPPAAAKGNARLGLEIKGEPRTLPGRAEIHLLRIAQQAVANAADHGAPREIRVTLEYGAQAIVLEVCDDGSGFDAAAPVAAGHFGIRGMRERADQLHAAISVESAPGRGATVRVTAPIEV